MRGYLAARAKGLCRPYRGDVQAPEQRNDRLLVADFTKNRLWELRYQLEEVLPRCRERRSGEFSGDNGPAARSRSHGAALRHGRSARRHLRFAIGGTEFGGSTPKRESFPQLRDQAWQGLAVTTDGQRSRRSSISHRALQWTPRAICFIADESNRIRRVDRKTGIIQTIAGTGRQGRFGFDVADGPALKADLFAPSSLTFDKSGNLLFLNDVNRVCRIDIGSGALSTIAGNGQSGFDGDGGPATRSHIDALGMALDPSGNLFLADWEPQPDTSTGWHDWDHPPFIRLATVFPPEAHTPRFSKRIGAAFDGNCVSIT